MTQTLHEIHKQTGAIFDDTNQVPISFSNDSEALTACQQAVAICDRSHWGLLQISGADRLSFLHNQSTNLINSRQPGQGCDTVFVTSTARTIDLATAYMTEEAVLLLVSPHRSQQLLSWLDRYIFPMDKVNLKDISDQFAVFSLMGPESSPLLKKLGATIAENLTLGDHWLDQVADTSLRLGVGSGLSMAGYTAIVPREAAGNLWLSLTKAGAVPLGDRIWEQLRIVQGRPVPDRELTEDYNPLEAGLWGNISFDKGCYIGQETIARLNTYKGVKQRLWGISLQGFVEPGTVITLNDEKVGKLTSVTETEGGWFGLGYIRTKAGGEGLKICLGNITGEVVSVPFLSHTQE